MRQELVRNLLKVLGIDLFARQLFPELVREFGELLGSIAEQNLLLLAREIQRFRDVDNGQFGALCIDYFQEICGVLGGGDALKSVVEAQQGRDTRNSLSLQHAPKILMPLLHPVNLDG